MSEQSYIPYPYAFTSKGLVALFARDRAPEGTYFNLDGFEVRQEGALSSRLGRTAITTNGTNNFPLVNGPNPLTITSFGRLKATGTNTYRYAFGHDVSGPGRPAWRRTGDTNGAYTQILLPGTNISGNALSAVTYRPAFSSTPYIFLADQSAMYKDNGLFSILQFWGVLPPFGYINASVGFSLPIASVTSNGDQNLAASNACVEVGNVVTVTAAFSGAFAWLQVGDQIRIAGSSVAAYNGTWTITAIPADPTQKTVQFVHGSSGLANSNGGVAAVSLATVALFSPPTVDVPTGVKVTITGNADATYNSTWTVRSGTGGTASFAIAVPFFNEALALGGSMAIISPGPDVTGNANNYDYRMTLYNQNTGGESNPTAVFVTRNMVAPTNQPVLLTWPAATFSYNDGQATHFRIYRRGGTLFAAWLLIGTVPVSFLFGSFLDVFPDSTIATNPVLQIDNDPPCTTTLASQYNSTVNGATAAGFVTMTVSDATTFYPYQVVLVDSGANQEFVLINQVLSTTQFKAIFQLPHANGVPVIMNSKPQQAMNLAAIGSQQAFLAGDPVNPNRLYYSKVQNPESFPPQNYIEIGVPSDPIMAVVAIRGQVFVFTQSRVYRILSYGGGTPQPIPTGSRHGLSANFAWAIAEQSIIYLSYDGVYSFLADDSTYISEQIEWVFSDKQPNLGPLDPLDSTKRSSAIAAYNKGEFFLCYTGVSGSKRRMIYDTVNKRWRNDSVSCDAMFFEEDTGELIISELGDGMIYKDRRSDWDQEGFVVGVRQSVAIPLNLETPSFDQGYPRNDKVYNEFTLDLDTGGSTLNVFLLFDNAATVVSLGTVGGVAGRKQVTFPINSGNGQVSKNVALRITGSVSPTVAAVHLYQWHIKAAVDAEQRKTFDTYWAKMGTDEFKFLKQGYFEILAPDPGGIAFNVYLEGSATAAYSFSLPQALVRTSVKVRFPAFKAKLWRFVATSAGDFKLYGESFLEVKKITTEKGYDKFKFGNISAQSGV